MITFLICVAIFLAALAGIYLFSSRIEEPTITDGLRDAENVLKARARNGR